MSITGLSGRADHREELSFCSGTGAGRELPSSLVIGASWDPSFGDRLRTSSHPGDSCAELVSATGTLRLGLSASSYSPTSFLLTV